MDFKEFNYLWGSAKESYSNYHIEGPKVLIFADAKEIEKLIFHDHKLVFETLDSLLRHLLDEKVEGDVLFSLKYPRRRFSNFEIRGNSLKKK